MDDNVEKWNKRKMKWWPAQRVWAGFEMSVVGLTNKFLDFQPNQITIYGDLISHLLALMLTCLSISLNWVQNI